MDGSLAPGQIYGLFNYCQYKIGTPKGVVSKKKKKGHHLMRSGFGVIHRPKNAQMSASADLFFFFFGDHPFGFCRIFDQKVGTSPEKAGRMVTLSIGGGISI